MQTKGVKYKMKRILLILIVLSVVFIICSCDAYTEVTISDIALYNDIWELPDRRMVDTSKLFPNSIDKNECIKFNCAYTTMLLGTRWQIELAIKYDSNSFEAEKSRLSEMCENSIVCGESKYFDSLAFATVWNLNSCFEYALCDEVNCTITYIYLELNYKDDLTIDSAYIPKNYELDMENTPQFSIY